VFISFFQQALLLAFVTPAAAALHSDRPLSALDFVAAGLYALLWLGETIADLQMFDWQTEKVSTARRVFEFQHPHLY
jgi:steroid 5-alpha reductase family enzyme